MVIRAKDVTTGPMLKLYTKGEIRNLMSDERKFKVGDIVHVAWVGAHKSSKTQSVYYPFVVTTLGKEGIYGVRPLDSHGGDNGEPLPIHERYLYLALKPTFPLDTSEISEDWRE